jgi:thiol:disulfide interchange protein
LTIASCQEEIALLVLLGSSPTQLRKFLMGRFMPANFMIVTIGVLLIAVAQWVCGEWLKEKQIFLNNWISWYTILAAIGILLLIALVNYHTIGKYLKYKK